MSHVEQEDGHEEFEHHPVQVSAEFQADGHTQSNKYCQQKK
jgi:hypothetical protein